MENLHLDNNKLNKTINPAVNLPRLSDGSLNLEAISTGKNEKGNYIVSDDILETYFKELPDGTTNPNNNKWVYSGGILRKADQETRNKGGEALRAKLEQRKQLKETINILLQRKADRADLEELGLPEGTDQQTAGVARMIDRWIKTGDYNTFKEIRDTVGEKPVDKIDAEVTQVTPEIEELIKRVASRNEIID